MVPPGSSLSGRALPGSRGDVQVRRAEGDGEQRFQTWGGLFAVNRTLQEVSLSRYPGWPEYRRRSWWLLPPIL
jgi:hypothetical protein